MSSIYFPGGVLLDISKNQLYLLVVWGKILKNLAIGNDSEILGKMFK